MQRHRVTCDGKTIHLVRFLSDQQARSLHDRSDSLAAALVKQGVATTLWVEQFGCDGMTTSRQDLATRVLP